MNLAFKRDATYSVSDYLKWDDSENWELIDGIAYNMVPNPGTRHQEIGGKVVADILVFLKGKPCKVFYELDVFLSENDVVKPDIMVVCDKNKLEENGCHGAPDFIVEILSPSTSKKDRTIKLFKYKQHGVKEYWIIYPTDNTITVFTLENGKYDTIAYSDDDDYIPVSIFGEQLKLDLKYIFE